MSDRARETAEIRALLVQRVDHLAATLVPGGKRVGPYWIGRNPVRADRHAGSFWVRLHGRAPGWWKDEATGDGGDVFKLIAYVNGTDFNGARAWAVEWLGGKAVIGTAAPQALANLEARRASVEAREAERLAQSRRRAFAGWLNAVSSLKGTVAETYLATRGIALDALADQPRALRFDPAARHRESEQVLPCIVALMTCSRTEQPLAVHRTYLDASGRGKAAVSPVRKIWPSYTGAAIRIARGETGLPPKDAIKQGLVDRLVICEGVEDGLSLAAACPELRVWAAGALGNVGQIQVPACSDTVIVAADNDWGKPQAAKLLAAGVAALEAQGKRVLVARSPLGKDANDAMMGAA